jgi:hypothetical protein
MAENFPDLKIRVYIKSRGRGGILWLYYGEHSFEWVPIPDCVAVFLAVLIAAVHAPRVPTNNHDTHGGVAPEDFSAAVANLFEAKCTPREYGKVAGIAYKARKVFRGLLTEAGVADAHALSLELILFVENYGYKIAAPSEALELTIENPPKRFPLA